MHTRSPDNTWRLLHRGIKTSMIQRPTYTSTKLVTWCGALMKSGKKEWPPNYNPHTPVPTLFSKTTTIYITSYWKSKTLSPWLSTTINSRLMRVPLLSNGHRRQLSSTECNCRPSLMDAVVTRVTYSGSVVSGLVCCPPSGKANRGGGLTGASCVTGNETRGMASHMWPRFMWIHLPFAAFLVIFVLPR